MTGEKGAKIGGSGDLSVAIDGRIADNLPGIIDGGASNVEKNVDFKAEFDDNGGLIVNINPVSTAEAGTDDVDFKLSNKAKRTILKVGGAVSAGAGLLAISVFIPPVFGVILAAVGGSVLTGYAANEAAPYVSEASSKVQKILAKHISLFANDPKSSSKHDPNALMHDALRAVSFIKSMIKKVTPDIQNIRSRKIGRSTKEFSEAMEKVEGYLKCMQDNISKLESSDGIDFKHAVDEIADFRSYISECASVAICEEDIDHDVDIDIECHDAPKSGISDAKLEHMSCEDKGSADELVESMSHMGI